MQWYAHRLKTRNLATIDVPVAVEACYTVWKWINIPEINSTSPYNTASPKTAWGTG